MWTFISRPSGILPGGISNFSRIPCPFLKRSTLARSGKRSDIPVSDISPLTAEMVFLFPAISRKETSTGNPATKRIPDLRFKMTDSTLSLSADTPRRSNWERIPSGSGTSGRTLRSARSFNRISPSNVFKSHSFFLKSFLPIIYPICQDNHQSAQMYTPVPSKSVSSHPGPAPCIWHFPAYA